MSIYIVVSQSIKSTGTAEYATGVTGMGFCCCRPQNCSPCWPPPAQNMLCSLWLCILHN